MWYSTRWSPSPRCDARNRYSTSHGLTSSRRRFSSSDLAIRVTRRYMVSCVNRDRRFPSLLAARRSSSRRSRSGLGVISALCVEVIPCRRRTAGARVFFNSQAETGGRRESYWLLQEGETHMQSAFSTYPPFSPDCLGAYSHECASITSDEARTRREGRETGMKGARVRLSLCGESKCLMRRAGTVGRTR